MQCYDAVVRSAAVGKTVFEAFQQQVHERIETGSMLTVRKFPVVHTRIGARASSVQRAFV